MSDKCGDDILEWARSSVIRRWQTALKSTAADSALTNTGNSRIDYWRQLDRHDPDLADLADRLLPELQ